MLPIVPSPLMRCCRGLQPMAGWLFGERGLLIDGPGPPSGRVEAYSEAFGSVSLDMLGIHVHSPSRLPTKVVKA